MKRDPKPVEIRRKVDAFAKKLAAEIHRLIEKHVDHVMDETHYSVIANMEAGIEGPRESRKLQIIQDKARNDRREQKREMPPPDTGRFARAKAFYLVIDEGRDTDCREGAGNNGLLEVRNAGPQRAVLWSCTERQSTQPGGSREARQAMGRRAATNPRCPQTARHLRAGRRRMMIDLGWHLWLAALRDTDRRRAVMAGDQWRRLFGIDVERKLMEKCAR